MALQAGIELTSEIRIKTDHGERAFAEGDRIVFTKNDQSVLRNGLIGTIQKITDTRLIVNMDD